VAKRIDPADRRKQLVEAAFRVIVDRGSTGARISDVAARAKVAPSLVTYYFPSRDDLVLEATRHGVDRFFEQQSAFLARIEDPWERLEAAITGAMPDNARDPDWIVLLEFWTTALRRGSLQTVAALFQTRVRAQYAAIIESGAASGRFAPTAPSEDIAASIIGMIDGLTLRVILNDPAIDPQGVARLVIGYARLAVGVADREGVP